MHRRCMCLGHAAIVGSAGRNFRFALAVGGVGETGTYVLFREIRKFTENVSIAHSAGQIAQNIVDRNPRLPGSMVMMSE